MTSVSVRVIARSKNQYSVVFLSGPNLSATWNKATYTLTVTLKSEQTAKALIDVINAVDFQGSRKVQALKLTTDGAFDGDADLEPDLLPETEYSPLGGLPLNNRDFSAGACNYCHDDDGALDINGDPKPLLIVNNHDTHHGASLLSNVNNGAGGTWSRCNVCHVPLVGAWRFI